MRTFTLRAAKAAAFSFVVLFPILAVAQPKIVAPTAIRQDEIFTVRITGLKPDSTHTIRAEFASRSGTIWRSDTEFRADSSGVIDTSTTPVSGSYTVADPQGLLWSMANTREKQGDASLFETDDQSAISIALREGDKTIAQHYVALRKRAIGVSTTEVRGDVTGTYLAPVNGRGLPGVIVLGGSEGGVARSQAAMIASHGFAALAVAYFGMDSLADDLERIPVETIDRAVTWLARQPGIDADRIALLGMSKGAELALLAAAHNPRIRAVVAIAPSSVVFQGIGRGQDPISSWTLKGVDVPFAPYVRTEEYTKSRRLLDLYIPSHEKAPAASQIRVENIAGPVMLVSGKDDTLWPSARMADDIAARLARNGFRHRVINRQFADAGHHAASVPMRPTADSVRLGGSARSIARAQIEAWNEMIAFLKSMKRTR